MGVPRGLSGAFTAQCPVLLAGDAARAELDGFEQLAPSLADIGFGVEGVSIEIGQAWRLAAGNGDETFNAEAKALPRAQRNVLNAARRQQEKTAGLHHAMQLAE